MGGVGVILAIMAFAGAMTPGLGATFTDIMPRYEGPEMALLIEGKIVRGDTDRFVSALARASAQHPDHRIRVIALNSPGGLLEEAEGLARAIRTSGFVTVVAEEAQCVSACTMLFAAGSRKIMSTGAHIGVHGAAIDGEQTDAALAATARLAKTYSAYGVPASVIGRMVVTPPQSVAWLTQYEILLFPWGAVQRCELDFAPMCLAGIDSEIARGPPGGIPADQRAGPALPVTPPLLTHLIYGVRQRHNIAS